MKINLPGLGVAMISCLGIWLNTAWSATQGTLGATSTGTINITLTVPSQAQITGLTDVTFTNQSPSVAASNAQNICVYSNTATKGYTVTATGNGASNAFTLTSAALTPIPYSVQFAGTSGQTSGTSLLTGVASTGFTSTAVNPTCSSAPLTTASLIVGITTTNLQLAQAGASYTGILTLLITPQ